MSDIITAAHGETIYDSALLYAEAGVSIFPVWGKKPAPIGTYSNGSPKLFPWRTFQYQRAHEGIIDTWHWNGLLKGIGLITGAISGNLVVLDLDGDDAITAFKGSFPRMMDTYQVLSGSGHGLHLYYHVDHLPPTTRAVGTHGGNYELRANGCYVVAPPSLHPDTGNAYIPISKWTIQRLPDMDMIVDWIRWLGPAKMQPRRAPTNESRPAWSKINRRAVEAIARALESKGYRVKGRWLFGACPMSERHKHGDAHHSFGFDTDSGRCHCFSCGFLKTLDVAARIGVDVNAYGGLWERA